MAPILRGSRVVLRPATSGDVAALAEILAEPAVACWFGGGDPATAAREWVEDDEAVAFAIEHQGEVIGSIQYYEELDPDYRHAGMDVFLGTRQHGKGLGPEALFLLSRYLFDERGHHRLITVPKLEHPLYVETLGRP